MLGALHEHRFRAYEAFQEAERLLRAGPVHEWEDYGPRLTNGELASQTNGD